MDISKADSLTLSYAQRVWIPLQETAFKNNLDTSLHKLFYVRGIPRDRFGDLAADVYVWCAGRAGEFDPERASLKTWMILQAIRLIASIRDGAWMEKRLGWNDVPECDFRRSYDGDTYLTLDMLISAEETPETILIAKENETARRVINRQVTIYAEMLTKKERQCLDLLLSTNFEISDRELASCLGMGGHSTAGKLRRRIYGEFGLRLLQFGVSLEGTKDV